MNEGWVELHYSAHARRAWDYTRHKRKWALIRVNRLCDCTPVELYMATSGRGRGVRMRGRGRDLPGISRAPQAARPKTPGNVADLKGYLHKLNESNFQTYGEMFADMVLGFARNEERLQEALELIFDTTVHSERGREVAALGAMICEKIANGPTSEPEAKSRVRVEFRRALLGRFQIEHKKREATRSISIETWLCVFTFLCEVYARVRVSGQPIKVIGKAVLSNIDFLLNVPDCDDDETDCVCSCLKLCGQYLQEQEGEQVEKVVSLLRSKVISRKSSCRVRCVIMEVIEYRLLGWSDPGMKLDNFYVDALADAVAEDELGDS